MIRENTFLPGKNLPNCIKEEKIQNLARHFSWTLISLWVFPDPFMLPYSQFRGLFLCFASVWKVIGWKLRGGDDEFSKIPYKKAHLKKSSMSHSGSIAENRVYQKTFTLETEEMHFPSIPTSLHPHCSLLKISPHCSSLTFIHSIQYTKLWEEKRSQEEGELRT